LKNERKQTCALCGRIVKANIHKYKVGEDYYIVDKDECATILRRLHSVYGSNFCVMLKEKAV
jgi:hypothetical protein